ncbi:late embryogenesis abundant protein 6-like [Lycium ferocissimum]|uniref:late embryogenesis abundant protein 6-like n=1 Tax=Lycium ferocissimum TaxID=112874 RepID=UPI0028164CC4|nr:late embryogenesis abundant protein 6-like [Lycium ferocissimum]
MHSVKEKVSNAASAAKEHVDIFKAKTEEKAEKAGARTKEEKDMAEERRKAKEAEAKMELHESKAGNAGEKLEGKHAHHHMGRAIGGHHGSAPYTAIPDAATNPLGGHHHGHPKTF